LPPDRVDDISDCEDIDVNILDDTLPADVPGSLELHTIHGVKVPENSENSSTTESEDAKREKKMKTGVESKWAKKWNCTTYADMQEIEKRRGDLIS
ncbi:hypothetical protein L9F63_018254, partial [Diploptera punctata]